MTKEEKERISDIYREYIEKRRAFEASLVPVVEKLKTFMENTGYTLNYKLFERPVKISKIKSINADKVRFDYTYKISSTETESRNEEPLSIGMFCDKVLKEGYVTDKEGKEYKIFLVPYER